MLPEPRLAVPQVIVPVRHFDRAALRAIAYARSISLDVTALCLAPEAKAAALTSRIRRRAPDVAVDTARGLGAYLDARERADPERPITVVLSDVVPSHWWSYMLDGEVLLKLRLLMRPNTVVVDVPTHI